MSHALPPFTFLQIDVVKASTILVDLESFLSRAVSIAKSTAGDEMKTRERTAGVLRSLLQILHTPGLNPDIDAICREQLVLPGTQASLGFHRFVLAVARDSTLTSVTQKPRKLRDCIGEPAESVVRLGRGVCLQGAGPDCLFAHFDSL